MIISSSRHDTLKLSMVIYLIKSTRNLTFASKVKIESKVMSRALNEDFAKGPCVFFMLDYGVFWSKINKFSFLSSFYLQMSFYFWNWLWITHKQGTAMKIKSYRWIHYANVGQMVVGVWWRWRGRMGEHSSSHHVWWSFISFHINLFSALCVKPDFISLLVCVCTFHRFAFIHWPETVCVCTFSELRFDVAVTFSQSG